jgi:hypothetical protein
VRASRVGLRSAISVPWRYEIAHRISIVSMALSSSEDDNVSAVSFCVTCLKGSYISIEVSFHAPGSKSHRPLRSSSVPMAFLSAAPSRNFMSTSKPLESWCLFRPPTSSAYLMVPTSALASSDSVSSASVSSLAPSFHTLVQEFRINNLRLWGEPNAPPDACSFQANALQPSNGGSRRYSVQLVCRRLLRGLRC